LCNFLVFMNTHFSIGHLKHNLDLSMELIFENNRCLFGRIFFNLLHS